MTPQTSESPKETRDRYRHLSSIDTRWMDNDAYGHVNNVVYYSFFDTAVNRWLIERGVLDIATSSAIGLVVETQCRYVAPITFPDVVTAGIRVAHLGSSSVRYEIGLFRNDEAEAAATGHFVHVYVDRATRKVTPIPEAVRAALEILRVLSLLFLLAACRAASPQGPAQRSPTPASNSTGVRAETVASGLVNPWALEFLPDGRMLVTERPGRLRIVARDGVLSPPVTGVPAVFAQSQGGLLTGGDRPNNFALAHVPARDRTSIAGQRPVGRSLDLQLANDRARQTQIELAAIQAARPGKLPLDRQIPRFRRYRDQELAVVVIADNRTLLRELAPLGTGDCEIAMRQRRESIQRRLR